MAVLLTFRVCQWHVAQRCPAKVDDQPCTKFDLVRVFTNWYVHGSSAIFFIVGIDVGLISVPRTCELKLHWDALWSLWKIWWWWSLLLGGGPPLCMLKQDEIRKVWNRRHIHHVHQHQIQWFNSVFQTSFSQKQAWKQNGWTIFNRKIDFSTTPSVPQGLVSSAPGWWWKYRDVYANVICNSGTTQPEVPHHAKSPISPVTWLPLSSLADKARGRSGLRSTVFSVSVTNIWCTQHNICVCVIICTV